jgi:mitochondrial splicing suppressor protein 51
VLGAHHGLVQLLLREREGEASSEVCRVQGTLLGAHNAENAGSLSMNRLQAIAQKSVKRLTGRYVMCHFTLLLANIDGAPALQKHKSVCHNNVTLAKALKEFESTSDVALIPGGISLYELDQRLEKFIRFHKYALMGACLHAVRAPEDLNNIRTNVLYVKLEVREDHDSQPSKFFRVVEAYPVSTQDGMRKPSPWPESLLQLRAMQDDSEKEKKQGMIGATLIDCPPLAIQTVPFGSIKDVDEIEVQEDWKQMLVHYVEEGKQFTSFGA